MANKKNIENVYNLAFTKDELVQKLLVRWAKRSNDGIEKYGNTMVEAEKPIDSWIKDAQEECQDFCTYLEKIRFKLKAMGVSEFDKKH